MASGMDASGARPTVSVIIANYNGRRYLPTTLRSVLGQSLSDIEVIVSDDASTDDSVALAQGIAQSDSRVSVLQAPANGGPAAARNRALDVARGRWIAVVDADDLLHPRRLEWLIAAAEAAGVDIIADNALAFDDQRRAPTTGILDAGSLRAAFTVDAAAYVRRNGLDQGGSSLGYLKPVIRASALGATRYDPRLIIAEDFDLILRLLLGGTSFLVQPAPLYFYRRHSVSISHRLSVAKVQPMLDADRDIIAGLQVSGGLTPTLQQALAARSATLARSLSYERIIEALKARSWARALTLCLRHPRAALGLSAPLKSALGRALQRSAPSDGPGLPVSYRLRWGEQGSAAAARHDSGTVELTIPALGAGGAAGPGGAWQCPLGSDLVAVTHAAIQLAGAATRPALAIACDAEDLKDWAAFLLHPDAPVTVDGAESSLAVPLTAVSAGRSQ